MFNIVPISGFKNKKEGNLFNIKFPEKKTPDTQKSPKLIKLQILVISLKYNFRTLSMIAVPSPSSITNGISKKI